MTITQKVEREKKIKAELNRVKKLYNDFPRDKKNVLSGLMNDASFMRVSLDELRDDIITNGMTELFEQGEQSFKRKRPEVDIYTTLLQRYSNVMKQLIDLLPVEIQKEEADQLMEFIRKGRIKK